MRILFDDDPGGIQKNDSPAIPQQFVTNDWNNCKQKPPLLQEATKDRPKLDQNAEPNLDQNAEPKAVRNR